jgi:glycosyltransferase involved in cell wall biosynthesis
VNKVSIITPSFNYSQFLSTAIQSTLHDPRNGSTDIEHVVMDGGSSDGTLAVLEEFPDTRLKWRTEPDAGQSDALNKALAVADGNIIGWLPTISTSPELCATQNSSS